VGDDLARAVAAVAAFVAPGHVHRAAVGHAAPASGSTCARATGARAAAG
jgi:hypothetical protein